MHARHERRRTGHSSGGIHLTGQDHINHPSHYAEGRKHEPIEVIEAWGLGFNLGNALKYISRAGRKDPERIEEDLRKAVWYINRELSRPLLGRIASRISRWLLRRKLKGRLSLNDVTTDWKLPSNLSIAIAMIYDGRNGCLQASTTLIECEIDMDYSEI